MRNGLMRKIATVALAVMMVVALVPQVSAKAAAKPEVRFKVGSDKIVKGKEVVTIKVTNDSDASVKIKQYICGYYDDAELMISGPAYFRSNKKTDITVASGKSKQISFTRLNEKNYPKRKFFTKSVYEANFYFTYKGTYYLADWQAQFGPGKVIKSKWTKDGVIEKSSQKKYIKFKNDIKLFL